VDKSGAANTSYLDIDTAGGELCVAGQVVEFDRLALPYNRRVTFSYTSFAEIDRANDRRVRGESSSVQLRLEIVNLVPNAPITEYDQTIVTPCTVKAGVQREGAKGRVTLRCTELLPDFAAFPGLTEALVENVDHAYGKQKRARAHVKRGELEIRHDGEPSTDAPPVTCSLSTPG
jgi:hypothetical protein